MQYRKIVPGAEKTVTTAGTRVRFTATSTRTGWIFVQARLSNTGIIYVGDVNVSSTNYMVALQPGQGFAVDTTMMRGIHGEFDESDFYADASVSGDKFVVTIEASRDLQ